MTYRKVVNIKNSDEKDALNSFIETAWNLTVYDIESTLRKVCTKVLKDRSVSKI